MKKNWLSILIIETGIIDNCLLSETEKYILVVFLQDGISYTEIGKKVGITRERVRQIIDNAFGKIVLSLKNLKAKSDLLDDVRNENVAIEKELSILREKYNSQINADHKRVQNKQLKFDFSTPNILIEDLSLSVRAKRALTTIGVRSIQDLSDLTKDKIDNMRGVGIKTIIEIMKVAKDYGIVIK